jgi:protease IV
MESVIKKIGLLIVIVGILAFSSMFVAVILSFAGSGTMYTEGNVAVIPVTGVITTTTDPWEYTVDPTYIRESIRQAEEDDTIKAIVFEINSPGGSAVASDEIGQAIKQTNKPTVAWIREMGASGGYWIASNTDHIIANRMSITGSVGVTASYVEFAGTLERYNATYQQLKGGEYKELGNPFSHLSPEERRILQAKIDRIHEFFLAEVQSNRNLSNATMKEIKTGEFFLGIEAYELGLVDELGSYPEVDRYLNQTLGEEPVYVRYEKPKSFFQELAFLKNDFLPETQSSLEIRT